uniref:Uncharacterized protein n=1 Tax=Dulem virus 85 TaxID=3145796 RepID=A0AAU8B6R4_9VIRU
MAKKKTRVRSPTLSHPKKVESLHTQEMRDPFRVARAGLLHRIFRRGVLDFIKNPLRRLQDAEDLRRRDDISSRQETYKRVDGRSAGYGYVADKPTVRSMRAPVHLVFHEPRKTAVCIRRQARRRVLFALRKAGKGARRPQKARWTAKSYVQCRSMR